MNRLFCEPVSDVSLGESCFFFTWKIWKKLNRRMHFHDLFHFFLIKSIFFFSDSENKWFFSFESELDTIHKLTIEWCESGSCPDKTLICGSIFQCKMSESEHAIEFRPNIGVTNHRTSASFRNALDDEHESILRESCEWIRSIQSWSELKHDILSGKNIDGSLVGVVELPDIRREKALIGQEERGLKHIHKKILQEYWRISYKIKKKLRSVDICHIIRCSSYIFHSWY